jgi:methyl-accepting chemotaxis protein
MSIRYKFFLAFSALVVLACSVAFSGFRGIAASGDLAVRLYDGWASIMPVRRMRR